MKMLRFLCACTALVLLLASCAERVPAPSGSLPDTPVSAAAEDVGPAQAEASAPEGLSLREQLYSPQTDMEHMPGDAPLPYLAAVSPAQIAAGSLDDLDLSIPTTFNITRPAEKLTTTYAKYFITGTSNPAQPLYFEGQEVIRQGTKGTFGVLVSLSMGENRFSFSQGGKTLTAVIVRGAAPSSAAPIDSLKQSSIYPARQGGVKVGGEIPVECIGPSGASVTATFGGVSVNLQQVAQADKGVPAVYRGKLPVGEDYEAAVTRRIGKITYKMTYNGATKEYASSGEMYVAGADSYIAVRIKDYIGVTYPDPKVPGNISEKLKMGATDYVHSEYITSDSEYFQLSSGHYLPKECAEIIEGEVRIGNRLSEVSSKVYQNCEIYYFSGSGNPAYSTWIKDNTLYLTLYNTNGSPTPGVSGSRVFSDVKAGVNGSAVTYAFSVNNPGRLWGYGVAYDGTTLQLRVRYRPSAGSASAPLAGVKVLLDPGHGGAQPGALGMTGPFGPSENIINLAHAFAARDALEALGAEVALTREDDITLSLDDRLRVIEMEDADIFLSLHHNSLTEDVDANKVAGMEIYYHTGLSKSLADNMMAGLANALNRSNKGVKQSYYRVTLMNYAPAVLCELGYISNPAEYEKSLDRSEILKVGKAIADGVVRAVNG